MLLRILLYSVLSFPIQCLSFTFIICMILHSLPTAIYLYLHRQIVNMCVLNSITILHLLFLSSTYFVFFHCPIACSQSHNRLQTIHTYTLTRFISCTLIPTQCTIRMQFRAQLKHLLRLLFHFLFALITFFVFMKENLTISVVNDERFE